MDKHTDCLWVKQNLPHYIANELSVTESLRIGDHLLECDDCKRLFVELQEVTSLISDIPSSLPEGFRDEIWENIRATRRRSSFTSLFSGTRYLYRFATVALLFFLLGAGTSWIYLSRKQFTYNWKEVKGPVLVDTSVTKFSTVESRFILNSKRM